MSPSEIRLLYDYNTWANRRALGAAEKLTANEFTRPMGSSFSSLRDTLVHIYGAEWIWMERMQGRSPSALPQAMDFPDTRGLRERWLAHDERLHSFVAGLSQEDLDREMEYRTLRFGIYRNPLWQSMQHLVNHGTYHRGQVTTLLRQLGAEPVITDLILFYREHPTQAD